MAVTAPKNEMNRETLTSRERLTRCFLHQDLDRPAVFCRANDLPKGDDSYQELETLIASKSDLKYTWNAESLIRPYDEEITVEAYSEDFSREIRKIKTPMGELIGTEFVGLKKQPGYVEKYYLESEDDVEKFLSLPSPEIGGEVDAFFDLDERIGDRGVPMIRLGSNPAAYVVNLFGSENFALMSIDQRDLLEVLMESRMKVVRRLIDHLLARGVGPFFGLAGEELIVPPLHGRRDFLDFNYRYDKPLIDRIHDAGGHVHVHCHGRIQKVFDLFVEMGVDVLHPFEAPPMGDVEPAEAKRLAGGTMCLEGNIQIADMYEKSPDDIRNQVNLLIEELFTDRRNTIICPTASPYIPGAGLRCLPQYEAMIDAVQNFAPASS
jgi:uroporphyrinogen-III decarboxylase